MQISAKDLALISSVIIATVTSIWAGVEYVTKTMDQHLQQPHPGALSRDELMPYLDLLLDRVRAIESRLEAIEAKL